MDRRDGGWIQIRSPRCSGSAPAPRPDDELATPGDVDWIDDGDVVARAAVDHVTLPVAGEDAIVGRPRERVVAAWSRVDAVVARPAEDDIVVGAAEQAIVPPATQHLIVAGAGADHVVAVVGADAVVARAGDNENSSAPRRSWRGSSP